MANVTWEILTPVSTEPTTAADTILRQYLRVDYSDEDGLINSLVSFAREYAEKITYKALAPQTIRATIEPDPIPEGILSGPIGGDFDPYRLNERITTVPFGFYGPIFDLPWFPISQVTTVEYQLTPFDGQPSPTMVWTNLVQTDTSGNLNWILDTNMIPMSIILRPLLVANRYRFTYTAGYGQPGGGGAYATGNIPNAILELIRAIVSFKFDNRQGQRIPDDITMDLARYRTWKL